MITVGSILGGTFRFVGNNVRPILVWSMLLLLLTLVMMVMMRPFYEAQIAIVQQTDGPPAMPPIGSFFLTMLLGLAVLVVLVAATFRAVLFPDQSRFAYLRLGMDELRLLACALVLIIGFYLIMIVFGIAAALLLVLLARLGGGPVASLVLIPLVMLIPSAWLMTRLSLAGPLTILQRKIAIGPAWRLSRGHFWQLLGAYVVIALVLTVVYGAVFLVRMGPAATDMLHPADHTAALRVASAQIAAYTLSPKNILIAVITSLVIGFAHALYAGGVAIAAAQLVDRGGPNLSEVFE